jgi:hypothetical protein
VVLRAGGRLTHVLLTGGWRSVSIEGVTERALRRDLQPLLWAVVLAQLTDLVTFIAAIGRTGIQAEQNILARELFLRAGDVGPILLKVAAVLTLVLLVRRVGRRFPAYARPAAWLAIAFGLVGLGSNIAFGLLG